MKTEVKCCDNPQLAPLDVIEGQVETKDDPHITGGKLIYEPTGWTEIIWDTQTEIGMICTFCDHLTPTTDHIMLGGVKWIREATS